MLSKEEIEKAKERISKSLNDVLYSTLYSQEKNEEDEKTLLAYIEELESDKQKLIEKLEEDKADLTKELRFDITKSEAKIQLKLINKYLEILKGEKK